MMDRKDEELDPVEQAILRISTYELLHRLDVPYQVVINEAVDLALHFGADQSHKFINGVLDKLAKELRKIEIEKSVKEIASDLVAPYQSLNWILYYLPACSGISE